jgi:nucleotide-binding universal stress UspA family protein
MERILLAVDGSESSRRAVGVAKSMAQGGWQVRVIQVDAPPIGTKVHAAHEAVEAAKEAAEEFAVGGTAVDAEVVGQRPQSGQGDTGQC